MSYISSSIFFGFRSKFAFSLVIVLPQIVSHSCSCEEMHWAGHYEANVTDSNSAVGYFDGSCALMLGSFGPAADQALCSACS